MVIKEIHVAAAAIVLSVIIVSFMGFRPRFDFPFQFHLNPSTTSQPLPIPSLKPIDSYLTQDEQGILQQDKDGLSPDRLKILESTLEPYNLSEKQKELALWLYLQYWGRLIDNHDGATDTYLSTWYGFTLQIPKGWAIFKGGKNRIGFLAPTNTWSGSGDYGIGQVTADIFFHPACDKNDSFEEFISQTILDRRKFYAGQKMYGPEEVTFQNKRIQKFTLYARIIDEQGTELPTVTVEDYYFQSGDLYYLFNYRWAPAGKTYRPALEAIAQSFKPGDKSCTYYDELFKPGELEEMQQKMFDSDPIWKLPS